MAITGIILAGGKSSRMGQDKGQMAFRSKPLIAFAIKALEAVADETIIIANDPAYERFGLPVYADLYPEKGALGGICTGLAHSKTEQNLVLSCDTPLVNESLLRYLLEKAADSSLAICSKDGAIEPLVGMYGKSLSPQLLTFLKNDQLAMRKVVSSLEHIEVDISKDLPFYHPDLFYNINRPGDLDHDPVFIPPGV